jgi:addiction module HigA family antidote
MATLPNIHPGEVLNEEFLIPFGLSQEMLAKEIDVPTPHIKDICSGQRSISADMALRFARFFGTTASFWLGLQADYDTEETERALHDTLSRICRYVPGKLKNEPSNLR